MGPNDEFKGKNDGISIRMLWEMLWESLLDFTGYRDFIVYLVIFLWDSRGAYGNFMGYVVGFHRIFLWDI